MEGRRLGDFEIVRLIGRGGMGAVYEAIQISLNRRVALKILSGAQALDPEAIVRFEREARAIARLSHPHIVPVHLVGEEDGVRFIVMDLVSDRSLADVIGTLVTRPSQGMQSAVAGGLGGPSHAVSAGTIGLRIAEALHAAHEQGIVHRDVKPSNILINEAGHPLLIDFGIAHEAGTATLTRTGRYVGTPLYASPEQLGRSHASVDQRTDVYSLGATLHELLTLRRLVEASSTTELLRKLPLVEPRPMRGGPFSVPRDLETVVLKAMEKDPSRRYSTARAFAEDLRRFLSGEPVLARPVGPLTRLARRVARRPVAAGAVMLVLLLIVVGGIAAKLSHDLAANRRIAGRARARELVEDAGADLHLKDYPAAIEKLDEAVSLDPESVEARFDLDLARVEGGLELESARRDLEALVSQRPDLRAPRALLNRLHTEPGTAVTERLELPDPALSGASEFLDCYTAAQAERLAGRTASAILWAERAQAASPKNLSGLLLLVRLYRDSGRTDDTYACARICATLAPDRAWATFNLASAEFRRGAFEEAAEHYRVAVERAPAHPQMRLQYAGALLPLGRLEDAEKEARQAVDLARRAFEARGDREARATLADALDTLGETLRALRRTEPAREAFDASLALESGHALALAHRARLLLPDRAGEAIAEARRALAAATDSREEAGAWVTLGQALHRSGDELAAIDAYRRALALEPTRDFAVRELVALLEKRGRAGEAAEVRHSAAVVADAPATLLCWVAQWLLKVDRAEEALRCARRATEKRPRFAEGHFTLGKAHRGLATKLRGKRLLASIASAAKAFEHGCKLDTKNAAGLCFLGDSEYQLRRFAEAATHYRAASELKPEAPGLRLNFAGALDLDSRRDEALRELAAIAEAHPRLAAAHAYLGFVHLLSGDADRARLDFEGAARLDPKDPEALVYLAMVEDAGGDGGAAAEKLAAAYAAGFRAPDPETFDGRLHDPRWLARLRSLLRDRRPDSIEALEDHALLFACEIDGEGSDVEAACSAAELAVARTERRQASALRCLALVHSAAGRTEDVARVCKEALELPALPDALRDEIERIASDSSSDRP